jgi:hypothetical protein
MKLRIAVTGLLLAGMLCAQRYDGPRPAKPDVPYLIHAENLVEPEIMEAKEEKKKDDITYYVQGAASSVKTPVAGPRFLLQADKLAPEKLALYRFEVKNNRREVTLSPNDKKSTKPIRVESTRVAEGLYRIEVYSSLENGEYGLSPDGTNQVFCFQVY